MARYIDAEKCAQKITALVELEWGYAGIDEDIKEIFNTIPAADVEPVVHASWKKSDNPNEDYCCSSCGGSSWQYDSCGVITKSTFCPNCGAKMDGKKEDD